MTYEEAVKLFAWIDTLPAVERTCLLQQVQAALAAGHLHPQDLVRLRLGADGHYQLLLAPQPAGQETP